ncbi:hypothetical protein PFNF135_04108 [Plasmodium falciparum NF135/5.C10]|uniref:Uncharacterized protein n=1 Tax=Plasmodium falciparum NF135/5.C10 TaxID=1036726 RepID=W4IEJ0_PLAFA|nr:hypothetical protein PFNF135_04108 [Plasmodium falciparum NF135/5.C10]
MALKIAICPTYKKNNIIFILFNPIYIIKRLIVIKCIKKDYFNRTCVNNISFISLFSIIRYY